MVFLRAKYEGFHPLGQVKTQKKIFFFFFKKKILGKNFNIARAIFLKKFFDKKILILRDLNHGIKIYIFVLWVTVPFDLFNINKNNFMY